MNCNGFIAFYSFKDTLVFRSVFGYGSIVHLRDMILSSVLQTQPTNQHKKSLNTITIQSAMTISFQ